MSKLAVITGIGGINAAGRGSSHHAYQRLVIDHLAAKQQTQTYQSLAHLMNLGELDVKHATVRERIRCGTLIRELEKGLFDSRQVYSHHRVKTVATDNADALSFCAQAAQLPAILPAGWKVRSLSDGTVRVDVQQASDFMLPVTRDLTVHMAGQLPTGLELSDKYCSRNHPRGLQMTVFAMSDALGNLGIDWNALKQRVPADQMSVYSGSAISQVDENGLGGLIQARLLGKRPSSKQLALGMGDMSANFINSYLLGSVGATGNLQGACAGFLYNLKQGVKDICEGRSRVAIVGASEAPLTPEVIEGFMTMGALATDDKLKMLDDGMLNYAKACRPFGDNKGFVIGESAQFVVLMDDELALELGANIYGSVGDVFVNADGFKKSISSPGIGNYISFAKAVAMSKAILGDKQFQQAYVLAHGTGTPQNRVTEGHLLNRVAKDFGFAKLPVLAPKAYLGHSIAAASGDQLAIALGIWSQGVLPGIFSIDNIADDVEQSHLDFVLKTRHLDPTSMHVAYINAKGFGGNNATATILAPHITKKMMAKKHGEKTMQSYFRNNEQVEKSSRDYENQCITGQAPVHYLFNHNVLSAENISSSDAKVSANSALSNLCVDLNIQNPYPDMSLETLE